MNFFKDEQLNLLLSFIKINSIQYNICNFKNKLNFDIHKYVYDEEFIIAFINAHFKDLLVYMQIDKFDNKEHIFKNYFIKLSSILISNFILNISININDYANNSKNNLLQKSKNISFLCNNRYTEFGYSINRIIQKLFNKKDNKEEFFITIWKAIYIISFIYSKSFVALSSKYNVGKYLHKLKFYSNYNKELSKKFKLMWILTDLLDNNSLNQSKSDDYVSNNSFFKFVCHNLDLMFMHYSLLNSIYLDLDISILNIEINGIENIIKSIISYNISSDNLDFSYNDCKKSCSDKTISNNKLSQNNSNFKESSKYNCETNDLNNCNYENNNNVEFLYNSFEYKQTKNITKFDIKEQVKAEIEGTKSLDKNIVLNNSFNSIKSYTEKNNNTTDFAKINDFNNILNNINLEKSINNDNKININRYFRLKKIINSKVKLISKLKNSIKLLKKDLKPKNKNSFFTVNHNLTTNGNFKNINNELKLKKLSKFDNLNKLTYDLKINKHCKNYLNKDLIDNVTILNLKDQISELKDKLTNYEDLKLNYSALKKEYEHNIDVLNSKIIKLNNSLMYNKYNNNNNSILNSYKQNNELNKFDRNISSNYYSEYSTNSTIKDNKCYINTNSNNFNNYFDKLLIQRIESFFVLKKSNNETNKHYNLKTNEKLNYSFHNSKLFTFNAKCMEDIITEKDNLEKEYIKVLKDMLLFKKEIKYLNKKICFSWRFSFIISSIYCFLIIYNYLFN